MVIFFVIAESVQLSVHKDLVSWTISRSDQSSNQIYICPDPTSEIAGNAPPALSPIEDFSKLDRLLAISSFYVVAQTQANMFAEVFVVLLCRPSIFPLFIEEMLVVWQSIPALLDNHARVLDVGTLVVMNIEL